MQEISEVVSNLNNKTERKFALNSILKWGYHCRKNTIEDSNKMASGQLKIIFKSRLIKNILNLCKTHGY